MNSKHLFWMALVKPRKSRCWLPMPEYGNVIIAYRKKACLEKARKALTQEFLDWYASANKFRKPSEWHVKAVRVVA